MRFIGIVTFATAALASAPGLTQAWPTNEYRKLTCSELAQEGREVSKKGFILSGLKAGVGGSEATQTAPEIVIVWPVPVGDKQGPVELALALKQMDAIEVTSVASQCSIRFQRSPSG